MYKGLCYPFTPLISAAAALAAVLALYFELSRRLADVM
jgi:hypothetical protein